jgi:hypothetical protein
MEVKTKEGTEDDKDCEEFPCVDHVHHGTTIFKNFMRDQFLTSEEKRKQTNLRKKNSIE